MVGKRLIKLLYTVCREKSVIIKESDIVNDMIDIVIPWVDGADIKWLEQKDRWYKALNPDRKSNSNNRYQNWDNLQYWFRAVEKNLPWIHKVYFVTWGHYPAFLNIQNDKLRIVKHEDYIPQEYLPTFNVNTIELNLHRIKDLGDNFIYFNDDTFPIAHINEEYYFRDNCVCDEAIETPIIPILDGEISQYTWNMRALDVSIINKHFNKREVQQLYHEKWFSNEYGDLLKRNESLSYWDNFVGFRDPHLPVAFKKKTFETLWEKEFDILDKTCSSKFRNNSCVNQWLVRYWQICDGNFYPRRTEGKSYRVTIDNYMTVTDVIRNQKQQMICLNEDCNKEEFEIIKKNVNDSFEEMFPVKSSFEL